MSASPFGFSVRVRIAHGVRLRVADFDLHPQLLDRLHLRPGPAGRAHDVGGIAYADGSNASLGPDNVFCTHTLEETGPGYYVIADSGCPA